MAKNTRKNSTKSSDALIAADIQNGLIVDPELIGNTMAVALAAKGIGTSGTAVEVAIKQNTLEPELVEVKNFMELFFSDIKGEVDTLHAQAEKELKELAWANAIMDKKYDLDRRVEAARNIYWQYAKPLIDQLEADRKAATAGKVWLVMTNADQIAAKIAWLKSVDAFKLAAPDLVAEMEALKPDIAKANAWFDANNERKNSRKEAADKKEVVTNPQNTK